MYKVAVIGCGIIGLTSALVIQEQFKNRIEVIIYTDKVSPNTTGNVSAGIWLPFKCGDTDIDDIIKWSKQTLDFFINLWKSGYADEAGICLQPVTIVYTEEREKYPEWLSVAMGTQLLSPEQLGRLNVETNKNYKTGFNFITVSAEPVKLLPFLQKRFISHEGVIKIKKITDLIQVSDYDLVINCSGIYSKTLMEDHLVQPIRGQVISASAPWQFNSILDAANFTHIIANYTTVVLGATIQYGDFNTDVVESDAKKILKNCYELIPTIKAAPILKHMVGLRPGRTTVRLEFEIKEIDGTNLNIIHNYGHGGSGVSLCYGCALPVAELVKQTLFNSSKL